jgi:predicted nucleic acid-binding Zn ribbon protein
MAGKFLIFIIFIFVLIINFSAALEADFDCPDKVEVNAEFECSLVVENFTGSYDVKVELVDNGKTLAKIWNFDEEKWKSTYYYLNDFVSGEGEEEKIKLKITEDYSGDLEGILKLRQDSKTKTFDFEIEVIEGSNVDEDAGGEGAGDGDEVNGGVDAENNIGWDADENNEGDNAMWSESDGGDGFILINEKVIKLNQQLKTEQINEIVYESKNEKIKKYAIYFFTGFLILIIIILLIRG